MAAPAPARPVAALGLVLLLGLAVLLNYIDRGAIAIAAPLLKPELGLTATQFGLAVSAFFWIYAPIQFAVGYACDRWCVYRLLAAGLALWALSTIAIGFVGGIGALVAFRLLLGLGESITFPGASKVIARHVAAENRGIANSTFALGIALGPVVGTLAGGLMVAAYGWRPMFFLFGAVTLLWVPVWLFKARRLPQFAPGKREAAPAFSAVARQKAPWIMGVTHFTATYPVYFIVSWIPLYLVQSRGFSLTEMTYIATLGFIAQAVSALVQGWASDRWTRSGRDEAAFRRWSCALAQLVLAVGVIGLMAARTPGTITIWLMVVGAANASAGLNLFAVAQMFAGPRASGSFIGIQNAIGNLAGIVGPIVTGMIIDTTGSYDNAYWLTAAVCLAGAFCWAFLVPTIRPLTLE
ncbi:MAG: MFS transporter [Sphingomicrobium sp.]